MKKKIIPFDLEMAKKIQAGEIEGAIKTRDEKDVLIVHWNKKDEDGYVILALIDMPETDLVASYTRNGKLSIMCESAHDLVLEVPDTDPHFKPLDKVLVRDGDNFEWCIALYAYYVDNTKLHRMVGGVCWSQCIPYEGNEHLLGTTDKPN